MGMIYKNGVPYFGGGGGGTGNVDSVNGISPDANKNVQVDIELTQAEYDALPSSKLTDDVNYWITDGANNPLNNNMYATGVVYDNTDSGLTATNVQDAIDEVSSGLTYNFVDLISNGTFPSQPTSSSSQTYTVPQNGMMFFWATRGSDPGWTLKINVNGHNEVFAFPAVVGYTIASISFPVKTGDTVNISTDNSVASWTVHQAKFIY